MISAHARWWGLEAAGPSPKIVGLNWAWEAPGKFGTGAMAPAPVIRFSGMGWELCLIYLFTYFGGAGNARQVLYHWPMPQAFISCYSRWLQTGTHLSTTSLSFMIWEKIRPSRENSCEPQLWAACPNFSKITPPNSCDVGQKQRLQLPWVWERPPEDRPGGSTL
jgi:hypothetical protein